MAEEAIARAKELDGYFRRTGKVVGPLVRFPVHLTGLEMLIGDSTVFQLV